MFNCIKNYMFFNKKKMEGYENSVILYVEIYFYCEFFVEYLMIF